MINACLSRKKNWNLVGFLIIVCIWIRQIKQNIVMLGFSPFQGKRQYTCLLRHSLVSLTNTFRVFVFLVLALLTWESGPCLKSCALKKTIHNSGFSINTSDLHLAVKKLTKSIINTSVLAASTFWKVKLWDKPSFKRHLRKKLLQVGKLFQVNPLYRNVYRAIHGVWSTWRTIYIC